MKLLVLLLLIKILTCCGVGENVNTNAALKNKRIHIKEDKNVKCLFRCKNYVRINGTSKLKFIQFSNYGLINTEKLRVKRKTGNRGSSAARSGSYLSSHSSSSISSSGSSSHYYYRNNYYGGYGSRGGGLGWRWIIGIIVAIIIITLIIWLTWYYIQKAKKNRFRPPQRYPASPYLSSFPQHRYPNFNNYENKSQQQPPPPPYFTAITV